MMTTFGLRGFYSLNENMAPPEIFPIASSSSGVTSSIASFAFCFSSLSVFFQVLLQKSVWCRTLGTLFPPGCHRTVTQTRGNGCKLPGAVAIYPVHVKTLLNPLYFAAACAKMALIWL